MGKSLKLLSFAKLTLICFDEQNLGERERCIVEIEHKKC